MIKRIGMVAGSFLTGGLAATFFLFRPSSSPEWAAWVQAVGSVLAILVAVAVSYWQHKAQDRRDQLREAKDVENMLNSIHDEIEILWLGFNEKIGETLLQSEPGVPFAVTWPAPDRPFIIYEGHIDRISMVQDADIRKAIIVTYARADGLLQSFRMNNALIQKYENAKKYDMDVSGQRAFSPRTAADHEAALVRYADSLRGSYREVESCVGHLLTSLRTRNTI